MGKFGSVQVIAFGFSFLLALLQDLNLPMHFLLWLLIYLCLVFHWAVFSVASSLVAHVRLARLTIVC
jgi:hypothetical protein